MPWGRNEPCARRRGPSSGHEVDGLFTFLIPPVVRCDNESGGKRTQHVTYGTPYVMG